MSASAPFYPPRAKGWRRLRSLRFLALRLFGVSSLDLPKNPGSTLAGYLLPWAGFKLTGTRASAICVLVVYLIALGGYVVGFGLPVSWFALFVMLSVHVLGASLFYRQRTPNVALSNKVAVLILVLALLFYGGGQFFLLKLGFSQP